MLKYRRCRDYIEYQGVELDWWDWILNFYIALASLIFVFVQMDSCYFRMCSRKVVYPRIGQK